MTKSPIETRAKFREATSISKPTFSVLFVMEERLIPENERFYSDKNTFVVKDWEQLDILWKRKETCFKNLVFIKTYEKGIDDEKFPKFFSRHCNRVRNFNTFIYDTSRYTEAEAMAVSPWSEN